MSDLSISKKNVHDIFSQKGTSFLIPDYQRPYSWKREQCETLWDDLKKFAIDNNKDFDDDKDEYFLGTIVTFKNEYDQNEVIDGQQRIITLLLLLRAFYEAFGENQNRTHNRISDCIWHLDRDDNPDKSKLKITSEVATDDDLAELKKIIDSGEATTGNKSLYAENYRYFQKEIDSFKMSMPNDFSIFAKRILDNCILLPIETRYQSTALRIFTTLNDRGMPLSDSDIFKAQFYKFYKAQGKDAKENFIKRWKNLEELCNKNFHPRTGTPTDDLFMRYMHYLIAKTSRTIPSAFKRVRNFYEANDYKFLRDESAFEDLMTLANFWNDIALRDERKFSARVLRQLYIMSYLPYNFWNYIVSIYFMGNRDSRNLLDEEKFYRFLKKITGMFLMHAIVNPGTMNIRAPFNGEFKNILEGHELRFKYYLQDRKTVRNLFMTTKFLSSKMITRAMLAWFAFQNDEQELPPLDTTLEIEHIFSKRRAEFEPFKDESSLELLGNKSLLEKRINILASDYRFADKAKYYLGYTKNNEFKRGTDILELRELAKTKKDFTETDIHERNERILNSFMNYLDTNNLLK